MFLYRIGRRLAAILVNISALEAIILVTAYGVISYAGLAFFNEPHITADISNFIYWLVVSASTVGYGDLSPATTAGKLFTAAFIIPIGLSLFAMIVTRLGYAVGNRITRRHRGLCMIDEKNHCLIIGWTPGRTKRLIELLTSKSNGLNESIVLCSEVQHENPVPDNVEFVKVESFLNEQEMGRCGIEHARRIIIDLSSDEATLTTALLCKKLNPSAHKTAYFQNENIGTLLKTHSPGIEVIPSVSIELLARATLDPGSSAVHQQLLDSTEGANQFSFIYKGKAIAFKQLFNALKDSVNATLIGLKNNTDEKIILNPELEHTINHGDCIFYYATARIDQHPAFLKLLSSFNES